uniref:Uncharacterized protein n=1 Tax=Fundulus heteroclitus TaxID=8078 RepID=A0A3Q2PPS6_FUNHE
MGKKKKRTLNEKGRTPETEEEETGVEVEIDSELDQALETKSKQHNLTTVNVKNIIHEVITNEHVVAMMKAAINETEAVPPFEPKMTRSKFKEVVEKGVVIPTWNISPIKKSSDAKKVKHNNLIVLYQDESGVMACRTRSKRPLRDVPLGQLEAELKAPDITPDMYDSSSAPEDRDWTDWLRDRRHCDDEDDPEYNFLAEIEEPDLEDYRDDKAVRITSQYRRIVFERVLKGRFYCWSSELKPYLEPGSASLPPLTLSSVCRSQHIQLLIQINLLTSPVPKLHSEAETTRQFLVTRCFLHFSTPLSDRPGFRSAFRAANLQGALELLEELRQTPIDYQPQSHKPDGRGHSEHPAAWLYQTHPELAWLFATRPVFLYPELLPCANLDPAMYCPRRTAAFTAAEDCLLVLGLRNMEGACDPPKLVSQFLLRKTVVQVRRRILQCCRPGTPDNIVKVRLKRPDQPPPPLSHRLCLLCRPSGISRWSGPCLRPAVVLTRRSSALLWRGKRTTCLSGSWYYSLVTYRDKITRLEIPD